MKRAENATISTGTITTTAGTAGITISKRESMVEKPITDKKAEV